MITRKDADSKKVDRFYKRVDRKIVRARKKGWTEIDLMVLKTFLISRFIGKLERQRKKSEVKDVYKKDYWS